MATSNALSTSNQYIKYKITITQNSQNIESNTSNVTVSVKFYRTNTGYTTSGSGTVSCKIDGTKYTASVDSSDKITSSGIVLFKKTLNISHESTGKKTLKVSAWISHDRFSSDEQSYSQTLTTIPRASSVLCSGGRITGNTVVAINKTSSSYKHTVTYAFGTLTGTIATKTAASEISWTIPESFYGQIPNATSGSGTITCETFSGSTSLGTKSCSFTVYIEPEYPSINLDIYDSNSTTVALTGDKRKVVKYYSNITYSVVGIAYNSATISSVYVANGSQKLTSSTGTFNNVLSGDVYVEVTDSRGYGHSTTGKLTLIDYIKPTCILSANITVDGTATINLSGNCFRGSFGSVSNTITVQYRYKVSGGSYSSWTNATTTFSTSSYTASSKVTGLDYTKTYVFQARVVDKLATVTTGEQSYKSKTVFDWSKDDFNFNVPVTIQGTNVMSYISSKADDGHTHSQYLTTSGGNISGSLAVSGGLSGTTLVAGNTSTNGGLELYHETPFIDFHFGRSGADYTSRIIESSSGTLSCIANLSASGNIYSEGYLSCAGRIKSINTYNTTGTAAANMVISSSYWTYRSSSSSKRYKHDIAPLSEKLNSEKLLNIPVHQYIYNLDYIDEADQRYNTEIPGFIAEEVHEAYPIAAEVVDGQIEDWNQRMIIPPMLDLIQKLWKRVDELEDEIKELKGEV